MFEGKGNACKCTFGWLDCINMMSRSNVLNTCLEYVSLFLAIILFKCIFGCTFKNHSGASLARE